MDIVITFLLIILATFIAVGISILVSKYSIKIEIEDIARIVGQVVSYVNQKFVNNAKADNPDHKLTSEQVETAFNMAYKLIKGALNDNQVKYLESKYGDIHSALDIIIESVVNNSKSYNYIESTPLITETADNGKDINWEKSSD